MARGVVTRIGIGSLLASHGGSIELPEEVTLHCPQCGSEVADKGQCLVSLVKIPGESKTGWVLGFDLDCRRCGCYGKSPAVDF